MIERLTGFKPGVFWLTAIFLYVCAGLAFANGILDVAVATFTDEALDWDVTLDWFGDAVSWLWFGLVHSLVARYKEQAAGGERA